MTIYAFPHCGSRRIRQGALYVGALTGAKEVCRNCHYQGMPLLFDTEEAYQQFLNEIKTGSTASSDPVPLTKEEKDVLSYAKESLSEKYETPIDKKPYGLPLLVAATFLYSLLLVPSIIMILLLMFDPSLQTFMEWYRIILLLYSIATIIIFPYGFIHHKKWAYTLSAILFILAFPTGLLFLYYLTRTHVKTYFHIGKSEP